MSQGDLLEPEEKPSTFKPTTEHVRKLLRKRYPAPEWALLEEVAPATGGGTRYADAIAINLWSSRGHAMHGFEIKISRGDWLRELKDPGKAESIFAYCDHWHIVAPRGVVKAGELPLTWGLFEVREASLVQQIAAPRLEATPVSRAFFASLMRRGEEQLARRAASMVQDERAEAYRRNQEDVAREVKSRTRELTNLEASIAKFTAATGLSLDPWGGPPIEIILLAQQIQKLSSGWGEKKQQLGRLIDLANEMDKTAKTMREVVASIGFGENEATE